MPQRPIVDANVEGVKPYQLLRALMWDRGLGPLPLAKRLGKPSLQTQIYRFINDEVKMPSPVTADLIAKYFDIPIQALWDEREATKEFAKRQLKPAPPPKPRARQSLDVDLTQPGEVEQSLLEAIARLVPDAREFVEIVSKLNPAKQNQFIEAVTPVLRVFAAADSGFVELVEEHERASKKAASG